jgi:hypothetical protein
MSFVKNLHTKIKLNESLFEKSLNTSQSKKNEILPNLKNQISIDDDWIAVKSLNNDIDNNNDSGLKNDIFNEKDQHLINIVSISIEKEKVITKFNDKQKHFLISETIIILKISIVTRNHNRLVTDDENTKQWFGVYTVEQLYSINKRICELDASLNEFFPEQLRPIKGILTSYFTEKLNYEKRNKGLSEFNDDDDLQDNELCNSFVDYLNKALNSIGKSLFIDILFNDINSDQYFEIYSEFNLKRIQCQIDKIKNKLFPVKQLSITSGIKQTNITNIKQVNSSLNELIKKQNEEQEQQQKLLLKQQLISNLKYILNSYSNDDNHTEILNNLYTEYYNNLLKPLIDSVEIAKSNLLKFTNKLINQEKSSKLFSTKYSTDALIQLKKIVDSNKHEIYELLNNIDEINIEYKKNLIDFYVNLLNKIKNDRDKFLQPSLNLNLTGLFDILTKMRKLKYNFNENIILMKI